MWKAALLAVFLLLPGVSQAEEFTIESLTRLLNEREHRDIDRILQGLPPFFRSHYTIAYHSQSVQHATPESPRVILYGPSAELILAFTDEKANYGGEVIEAIQYRRDRARFEFFNIETDSAGRYRVTPGQTCTGCHGEDPRPNFQPYATWPGFFASDDDVLVGAGTPREEKPWLESFIAGADSRPRYRHLIDLADQYRSNGGLRTKVAHGFELTFRIAQLNYRRVARILSERPDWARYKFAWLASVACHSSFEQALPESMRPQTRGWAPFAQTLGNDGKEPAFLYLARTLGIDVLFLTTQVPGLTGVTPFRGNIFGSGGSSPDEMIGQLFDWDPELALYGSSFDYRRGEMTARFGRVGACDRLYARSREALGG